MSTGRFVFILQEIPYHDVHTVASSRYETDARVMVEAATEAATV